MLTPEQLKQQSIAAYTQWGPQWKLHASIVNFYTNAEKTRFKMKSLDQLKNTGIGKAVLCIANGYSFEENIETIKKYQGNVDILACDKTLGHCLENGITPTYCLVCDANVSYELYMEKYKDQLQDTILITNVCANPKWIQKGNWKDAYFFVNKDVLKSEKEFSKLSGCKNFIPAGTNVSNAMVVFLTQSDERGRINFFGYDKILLTGFDYSWKNNKYYAFNESGNGKNNYMRHVYAINNNGDYCFSSNNLIFSAKWLNDYINVYKLPVVQCTRNTIFSTKYNGKLDEQMQYEYKQNDCKAVKHLLTKKDELLRLLRDTDKMITNIAKDHWNNLIVST